MPAGPGKYDELCTIVREESHAEGAIVIILNGDRGCGFSVQVTYLAALLGLVDFLKHVAEEIERSIPEV